MTVRDKQSQVAAAFAVIADVTRILTDAIDSGREWTATTTAGAVDGRPQRGCATRRASGGYEILISVSPDPAKPSARCRPGSVDRLRTHRPLRGR